MRDKSWLIRFKQSNLNTEFLVASTAVIYREHLVFLHADGSLAALFFLEIVEGWSGIDLQGESGLSR
jgi:hypothetical protein